MRDGDSQKGILAPKGENELADLIREKIGAEDDEEVEVVTPQFVRPTGDPVPAPGGSDKEWWETLRGLDKNALKELGCRPWNDPHDVEEEDEEFQQEVGENMMLMLFPGEWYSKIPVGYEIVDMFGTREEFVPGETDNDIRFGVLGFGILIEMKPLH